MQKAAYHLVKGYLMRQKCVVVVGRPQVTRIGGGEALWRVGTLN